jgi:hypothetical protein
LRRRSPELQLGIEGVRRILMLPLLALVQHVLLDCVHKLLEVPRVLPLHLLLLLQPLPLEVLDLMVLLQLEDKNKRLLFQQTN